ncbi:hypothetical protein IQ230_04755 [Gloeocapsopsis crepidinum LEGE 06123]|uniref:Uncharacterized protein n=1 Tax=Gloeocapsopsis crepidinum LEGE 06123 TaxID=588587 RepID=A0ABR9UPY8_9CHRO|nr:hypothetical protein [Gloeocapsopsis crepidinum]MBE9189685.1 hypothetical protein [Gloeocapsopsis crepidinum LEGE 06123]
MTTTISAQAYEELWQKANPTLQQPNSLNYSNTTLKYPPQLGQGFQREIHLHEAIELTIDSCQFHSNLTTQFDEHDIMLWKVLPAAITSIVARLIFLVHSI